ncbi:MAG: hypothetical protein ACTSSA_04755 [Candidatus Freyarchaeota archaeon]
MKNEAFKEPSGGLQDPKEEAKKLLAEGFPEELIQAKTGLSLHQLWGLKGAAVKKSRAKAPLEAEKELRHSTKILKHILKKLRIPKETVEVIADLFEEDPELYEERPQQLYSLLLGMDVKPNKASLIINSFFNKLKPPTTNFQQNPPTCSHRIFRSRARSTRWISKSRGSERNSATC